MGVLGDLGSALLGAGYANPALGGAAILTLEVMKMEQTLRALVAGVLRAIKCKVGDIVQEGVELAVVEPASE